MKRKLILIGGGGHCRSVLQGMRRMNVPVAGIIDVPEKVGTEVLGISVMGTDSDLSNYINDYQAMVTVGSTKDNSIRKQLYDRLVSMGFDIASFISDSSKISADVVINRGSVVLDSSLINTGTMVGENCIINTGAIIDHDCKIGDHVHIAPGVVMSGGVQVGDMAFVGVGAVVKDGVKIGNNAVVAAGAVVVSDVPNSVTVMGCPAK